MKKTIPLAILLLLSFSLVKLADAQISQEDVNQQNQEIFPQYTNIYTFNSHTQFQIPSGESTLIFTSGAGHHTDTTDTFIAAVAETDSVTSEQQAIADGDPLRHLWVYDREQYSSPEQYADSLHNFLGKYFTITDMQGRTVNQVGKQTDLDGNTSFQFDFNNLAKGIYLISLKTEGKVYTTKVLKR